MTAEVLYKKLQDALPSSSLFAGGGKDAEVMLERFSLAGRVAALAMAAWFASGTAVQLSRTLIPVVIPPGTVGSPAARPASATAAVRPLDYYAPVWEHSVFSPGGSAAPPAEAPGAETPLAEIPLSSLSYQLIGTVAGPPAIAFAIIQTLADKTQGLYRTGEMLGPAFVKRIERNRVILDNNGREEMLEVKFDETALAGRKDGTASAPVKGVTKVAADRYVLDKTEVDRLSGDVSQFMTQVRVVPNLEGGHAAGFKLLNVKPGSLVESVGLKDGDVVRQINGKSIDKPEEAFTAYQQLKNGGAFSIELERSGRRETLRYEIR